MERAASPPGSGRAPSPAGWLGFGLLLVGALAWSWRVARDTTARHGQTAALVAATPAEGRPDEFAGSHQCRACHPSQYASWHRTFHRTMTQRATRTSVQGRFDGRTLRFPGLDVRPFEQDGTYWIDAGDGARQVVLVTGSHNMQVYWTRDSDQGSMRSVPIAWLIPEARWVPNESTLLRPPEEEPGYTWNRVCIKCHAVAGQPGFEPGRASIETRVAELGIACEACHGPGARHVQLNRNPGTRYEQHLKVADPDSVVNPVDLDAQRSSEVCGQCHGISVFTDETSWLQQGSTYRSGGQLERSARTVRHPFNADQPWMDAVLERDPEFFLGRFWPDGMVRVSGREYNAMIETGCHTAGDMACTTCHSMHGASPTDQLKTSAQTDLACVDCHPSQADLAAHAHHPSGSVACVDCHMPHTTYGLLKAIRSHHISSPNVTESLEAGRPNACNACHLDRSLGWTAENLGRWYGHPIPDSPGLSDPTAAIIVWALAGDAGQRALAAWHLGWSTAHEVAGSRWVAAYLVELLDDPYDAVRIVAHRALSGLPEFGPVETDPVAPPEVRDETLPRDRARAAAMLRGAPANPGLLIQAPGMLDAAAVDALRRARNDRPVRLEE